MIKSPAPSAFTSAAAIAHPSPSPRLMLGITPPLVAPWKVWPLSKLVCTWTDVPAGRLAFHDISEDVTGPIPRNMGMVGEILVPVGRTRWVAVVNATPEPLSTPLLLSAVLSCTTVPLPSLNVQ